MKTKFTILALALAFLFLGYSCKDNSTNDVTESIQSAEDNAVVENEYSAVFDYVNDEGNNETFGISSDKKAPEVQVRGELLPDCATVTKDTINKIVVINFGTENCLCRDGHYRRGVIVAQFTGKWKEDGSSVSVTLENYYVDDMKVTGTKTITRLAANKWSTVVTNASIEKENGTVSWETSRTVERIEGHNTPTIWDDKYEVTGSASGTNINGINFTVTIVEPLIKEISIGCYKNFTSGIWTLTNENGKTMTLNYDPIGGAPCDKIADVTINGKTRRIILK